jgi:hypothetical protein
MGLATPDHTVPYGTVLSRTLSQALRARLRSVCPYGTGLQRAGNESREAAALLRYLVTIISSYSALPSWTMMPISYSAAS